MTATTARSFVTAASPYVDIWGTIRRRGSFDYSIVPLSRAEKTAVRAGARGAPRWRHAHALAPTRRRLDRVYAVRRVAAPVERMAQPRPPRACTDVERSGRLPDARELLRARDDAVLGRSVLARRGTLG